METAFLKKLFNPILLELNTPMLITECFSINIPKREEILLLLMIFRMDTLSFALIWMDRVLKM